MLDFQAAGYCAYTAPTDTTWRFMRLMKAGCRWQLLLLQRYAASCCSKSFSQHRSVITETGRLRSLSFGTSHGTHPPNTGRAVTSEMCLCGQGLLALEGELTPILVQMVKSANMNGLLDNDSDSLSSCQHRVKGRLHEILQKDRDFTDEDYDRVTNQLCLALTCQSSLCGYIGEHVW